MNPKHCRIAWPQLSLSASVEPWRRSHPLSIPPRGFRKCTKYNRSKHQTRWVKRLCPLARSSDLLCLLDRPPPPLLISMLSPHKPRLPSPRSRSRRYRFLMDREVHSQPRHRDPSPFRALSVVAMLRQTVDRVLGEQTWMIPQALRASRQP